jgi:hypothetical protein
MSDSSLVSWMCGGLCEVRLSLSHGDNTGSNPVGDAIENKRVRSQITPNPDPTLSHRMDVAGSMLTLYWVALGDVERGCEVVLLVAFFRSAPL